MLFYCCVGTDDILVVMGGFGSQQNMVEAVEQYDPKTGEWSRKPVSKAVP
jgi:kelch-like protein 12